MPWKVSLTVRLLLSDCCHLLQLGAYKVLNIKKTYTCLLSFIASPDASVLVFHGKLLNPRMWLYNCGIFCGIFELFSAEGDVDLNLTSK